MDNILNRIFIVFVLTVFTQVGIADEYYDKHFKGKLNLNYSGIGDPNNNYRENTNLTFGWQDDFDGSVATLGLEVYAFYSRARYFSENTYILNTNRVIDGTMRTAGRYRRSEGVIYTFDDTRLNQGYLKLSGEWAEWTIGKQIIVWGQFDFVSPVDLTLPLDFSDSSLKLSKVENRLPLTASKITFYPDAEVEISFYYLPEIERDNITTELNRTTELQGGVPIPGQTVTVMDNMGGGDPMLPRLGSATQVVNIDNDNKPTNAFRLVYTGEEVSFGLSYIESYWTFAASDNRTIVAAFDAETDYRPTGESTTFDPSQNTPLFNQAATKEYESFKAVGIELSIPDGNTTYKFEYLRGLTKIEIGDTPIPGCANAYLAALNPGDATRYLGCNPGAQNTTQREDQLYRFITETNGNRLYVSGYPDLLGVGVDYYGEDWTVLFTFVQFSFRPDKNAEIGESLGIELFETVGGPALAATYRWGESRANAFSMSLGFIGIASGLALGYTYSIEEGIDYYIGAEVLQFSSDSDVEDDIRESAIEEGFDDVEVELSGATTLSLRTGFAISF